MLARSGVLGGWLAIGSSLGLFALVMVAVAGTQEPGDYRQGFAGLVIVLGLIVVLPPLLAGIGAARGHVSGEALGAILCWLLGLYWLWQIALLDAALGPQIAAAVLTAGFLGAAVLLTIAVGRRVLRSSEPSLTPIPKTKPVLRDIRDLNYESGPTAAKPRSDPPSSPPQSVAPTPANQPDPGTIWFGTSLDSYLMTMDSHAETFSSQTPFGWIAIFSGPPNATSVTFTIASVDSGGVETSVDTGTVPWSDPQADSFAHELDQSLAAFGTGTFTFRYVVGGTVLAAGTVTITT